MQISTTSRLFLTRPLFSVYRGDWPLAVAASIADYKERRDFSVAVQRFLDTSATYLLTPPAIDSDEPVAIRRTRHRR